MSIKTRTIPVATALAMLVTTAYAGAAQTIAPKTKPWELRFTTGAFVPTGDLRSTLKNAEVSGAQLSFTVHPAVALTGSFAWARSRDVATAAAPKLDVFTSDVGAEMRVAPWFAGRAVSFAPFIGLGGGARSYNYRKLDVDATNNLAAYGAVGGELGMGRVALRLELRDYASGFKPLVGAGKSVTRNDVVITGALRFNRQRAPKN
jgi:hypothetical protein